MSLPFLPFVLFASTLLTGKFLLPVGASKMTKLEVDKVSVCDAACLEKVHAICLYNQTGIIDPSLFGLNTVCAIAEVKGTARYVVSGITLKPAGIMGMVKIHNDSSAEISLVMKIQGISIEQVDLIRSGATLNVFVRAKPYKLFYFVLLGSTTRAVQCLSVSSKDSPFSNEAPGWGIFLNKSKNCN